MKKAIVIGAGFGGLSAAAYLAKDGYQVTVIEKNEQSGGRARLWQEKGYTFDMGPSWYMMPEVFEKFFADFGKTPDQYYTLRRLDPSYRMYFGAGDVLDISADVEKNCELFESIEPGAGQKLREYLAQAKYQYDIAMREFIYKNFSSLRSFLNQRLLIEGRKLHVFGSLDALTRRFFKNERLRKVLQYSMVFLGGSPKNTPALYSVINHADFNLGIWYPIGGLGAVAKGMEKLCRELGVEFVFDAPVLEIMTDGRRASGVRTAHGTYSADVVVSNADYHHTETVLLPEQARSYSARYWKTRTIAPSAFIVYLGVRKKLTGLQHHTLFLDNDWERHFNAIFDTPSWPEYPSYYVCTSSVTDTTVAPQGCENLFVLVPIASGLEDTPEIRTAYRNKIVKHLQEILGEEFENDIEVERVFTLNDFSSDYNSLQGTALGLSHTLRQTAVLRPGMRSKKLDNVYFVGQFTQPGIGVPMVTISGQLVAETIAQDV